MTMRYAHRATWLIWMLAVLALLFIAFNGTVKAHEPEEVVVCQAEDVLGDFTIPIGQEPDLLALCNEVGGTLGIIDDPGPNELIRIMWELGLYNPYILMVDEFFAGTELEESPPPLE